MRKVNSPQIEPTRHTRTVTSNVNFRVSSGSTVSTNGKPTDFVGPNIISIKSIDELLLEQKPAAALNSARHAGRLLYLIILSIEIRCDDKIM